jgi:hypothetical protein
MTDFPPDSLVEVRPFVHSRNGDTVTIGDVDRQVFLAIPPEGLDILQGLADGVTVGEAARRFEERHGQPVDINEFLQALETEGFVAPPGTPESTDGTGAPRKFVSHLEWISPGLARRLLGPAVLTACGLLTVAGVVFIATDPGVMPNFDALKFPRHLAMLTWVTFIIGTAGLMIHEFAHVIAARTAGAPARIGLGHRLYVPVIETDMTAIWLAPKRRRYLGFLAGAIIDAATMSILLGVLWAARHGAFHLGDTGVLLLKAVIFTYLGRLLWQTFLFMRTDFYYAVATAFDCKNLMTDTENYMENLIAKVRRARPVADQSGIPRGEMWVIRVFTLFWIFGRFASIGALVTVTIPTLWFWMRTSWDFLTNPGTIISGFDFLTATLLAASITVLGMVMWTRALYRGFMKRRASYREGRAAYRADRAAEAKAGETRAAEARATA